jgi:hypothetical protein
MFGGLMDSYTIIQRRARAALEDAFQRTGIPLDFVVLPHQDDHEQLMVAGPMEVRWVRDDWSYCIATIHMDTELTGPVCGDHMYRISESDAFIPEGYGIERPYRFELNFDLTDIERLHRQAWESLPKAKFKRRRVFQPKVIM